MRDKPIPYRATVFVCTNVRADGRVACGNPGRGGVELRAALKDGIEKAGLKGKVRVANCGCLDLCAQGPNAFVYPRGEWLSEATAADAPEILLKLATPKP